jgi:outer membrane protein, multidrug efflux system
MFRRNVNISLGLLSVFLIVAGCKVPPLSQVKENRMMPVAYTDNQDTSNISTVQWKSFFADPYLIDLIDIALMRNQELNITLQEVEMAANDIRFRQGVLQPRVGLKLSAGVEKVGRYTSQGAGDASTEITKGKEVPEVLPDYTGALFQRRLL